MVWRTSSTKSADESARTRHNPVTERENLTYAPKNINVPPKKKRKSNIYTQSRVRQLGIKKILYSSRPVS
jgi:hypothetical protein